MQIETIKYKGWEECLCLSNDQVDMVVTTMVGPRIIRFGFRDEDNEFRKFSETLGMAGGKEWHSYGGHRLWVAPEDYSHTYFPDNEPVEVQQLGDFVRLTPLPETTTGLQKEIDVYLDKRAAKARLVHRLINKGVWAIQLAPWAITVMEVGGVAILPLPPRGEHGVNLLPNVNLSLWAYTDMSDPRWTWGKKYILMHQDPHAKTEQKIGALDTAGWIAYARAGHLFVKRFSYIPNAQYPDGGVNAEIYAQTDMAEIETLGPLTTLEPGKSVEYEEIWALYKDVPQPKDDADVEKYILPKIG